MKKTIAFAALAAVLGGGAVEAAEAAKPIEVRVRKTASGPRLCVNGQPVRPRFYYGSGPCLYNISNPEPVRPFVFPIRAETTTDRFRVELEVYPGEGPVDWYDAALVDVDYGLTNSLPGKVRAKRYVRDDLQVEAGHLYRFLVWIKADHTRTYFTHKASYLQADGTWKPVALPYGDTLGETIALAADAGVDFVTCSTDSSWGCEKWWNEAGDETGYRRIDALIEHLIQINPHALIVPRVSANAPDWYLEKHPEAKMKFHRGFTIGMSSVSYRPYRQAACEAVEKLARHLRAKFPQNFAGLHISGQNSAEWFYMASGGYDRSGYDVGTVTAFREYLKAKGESDWQTAEVPDGESRMTESESGLLDPVKDRRLIDFHHFRNVEMASFLKELGEAVRRGTDGKLLSLFFYGYHWELATSDAGAGESGHFAVDWLNRNAPDAADGFSSPLSYRDRNLTGSPTYMSAIETAQRRGYLWINEDDTRTFREEFWDHQSIFAPHSDRWTSVQILKRDSIAGILRGYGDWWMDLFGRGWHLDAELWKVRKELNSLDDELLNRQRPYTPEIAVVLDEESLLRTGWLSFQKFRPLFNRSGLARSGVTYGQYLLNDFLENPPAVKLAYLVACWDLQGERRQRFEALKAAHPEIAFVETTNGDDLLASAIQARAKAAGCHAYTEPEKAVIEAAEGYVMVQARQSGRLEVDLGGGRKRSDYFRQGEVKLYGPEPQLRIAVMSDLQGYDFAEFTGMRNLERMLDVFAPLQPDVVVNNGDIGDNGVEGWKGARYYRERCDARLGKLPHVVTIGNHELCGWVPKDLAQECTPERNQRLFNAAFGLNENRVQTWTIKGYDFIATSFKDAGGHTEAELAEVKAALERAVRRDSKKPIFVVTHYHPYDTVPGSQNEQMHGPLRRLLNAYPQVISLSGHTHRPLLDPRSIWQGEFTVIDTCTLSYGVEELTPPARNQFYELMPYAHEATGGLFIEVYAHKAVMKRYSARTREELAPYERWEFALPYDPRQPKYDYASRVAAERAPEFPVEVEPTVWWDAGYYYFAWRPVKNPEKVLAYRVDAVDQTGRVQTWNYLADFYRTPANRQDRCVLKLTPDPFKFGDRVTVKITPVGFFGVEGKPCEWAFTSGFRYKNRQEELATCPQ